MTADEELATIRAHHAAPPTETGRWFGAAHEVVGRLLDEVERLKAEVAATDKLRGVYSDLKAQCAMNGACATIGETDRAETEGWSVTDEELNVIRARLKVATPAPWHKHTSVNGYEISGDLTANSIATVELWEDEDAELIVNAPTDIGRLLDEVDRLRERLAVVGGGFGEHD